MPCPDFTDDFDGASLSANWFNWASPTSLVTIDSNQLSISTQATGSYQGIVSTSNIDLTSCYAHIELVDAGDLTQTSYEVYPVQLTYIGGALNSNARWLIAGNQMYVLTNKGAGNVTEFSDTYDPDVHKWFRIREDSGDIYYDTSTDGITWTNQHSHEAYVEMDWTDMQVDIMTGTWTDEGSATTALFDNFNVTSTSNYSLSGTLIYGGAVNGNTATTSSISGTLSYGGSVEGTVEATLEQFTRKEYEYKVYDPSTGDFIGRWEDVVSEFSYSQEINSAGAAIDITLARTADSVTRSLQALSTDAQGNLITDSSVEIAAEEQTTNAVGPGTSVDLNLDVKVYVYPEGAEDIEGTLIFTGYISKYVANYGEEENTIVTLFSYGAELDNYVLRDSEGATRIPFNSYDPSHILKDALLRFGQNDGTAQAFGETKKSFQLDGTSDYIRINDHSDTNGIAAATSTDDDYSLAFWVKSAAKTKPEALFGVNTSSDGNHLLLYTNNSTSTTKLGLTNINQDTGPDTYSTVDVWDDTWHHIVVTVDGHTAFKLYVDGVEDLSFSSNDPSVLGSGAVFTLGGEYDGAGAHTMTDFFTGEISEFIMWSDVLTSTEVTDLYNDGTIPSGNLLVHLDPNQDTGSQVLDHSGNDKDPILEGDGLIPITFEHQTVDFSGTESIDDTETTVSYTFNVNTMLEVVKKVLELAPTDWYWWYDMANNYIHFHDKPDNPSHTFVLGKHIIQFNLEKYIEDITNLVYFTGGDTGSGTNLFKVYSDQTSIDNYRRGLQRLTDNRVTLADSAQILSESLIDRGSEPRYRSNITVSDKVYDIESIQLGQVVNFRNFGNFIDELEMQIVRLDYSPDSVKLQLDTLLPSVPKRLEDIKRNLRQEELEANPDEPS